MRFFLLLGSILLSACAISPSQDSDFVNYGEEPEGPGVFSGDSGEILLFDDDDTGASAESGPAPSGLSASDWEEFNAFKRWLRSREARDDQYLEFQQWRQFEQYKSWQESQ